MLRLIALKLPRQLVSLSASSKTYGLMIHNFCSSKQPPKIKMDIKQEDNKEKLNFYKNKIISILKSELFYCYILLGGMLFYFVFVQIIKARRRYQKSDEYLLKKLKQKHLEKFEQTNFIHGKSIENKFRSILQSSYKNLILILGPDGIGKTQAIKQIITEKRQKERVYYIKLNYNSLQNMKYLVHAIHVQYDGSIPTTLIIDDIHMMKQIKQDIKRYYRKQQIICLSKIGVKVILITNSTNFYQNIWQREFNNHHDMCLFSNSYIIQMMKEQQSSEILRKEGQKLKINKILVDRVISQGLSLEDSILLLQSIAINEIKYKQKIMQFVQTKLKIIKGTISRNLFDQLRKFDDKASYQILKGFTKNKIQDKDQVFDVFYKNCGQIIEKEKYNQYKQAFAILDKQNLIFMCLPRSKLIRKVFQEGMDQLKKKLENK